jgi:hypothetical protein
MIGRPSILPYASIPPSAKGIKSPNVGINWTAYWATRTPTNLSATASSTTVIGVTWTDAAEAADGLKLYISTDNITFTLKGTIAFGVGTYSATGLTSDTLYYFKLVAYKGTHESDAITDNETTIALPSDLANLNMWIKSRSGAELVDSEGGTNPTIYTPYITKPTGNEYAYFVDNGALDIVNNLGKNPLAAAPNDLGFTFAAWIKGETLNNPITAFYYAGKNAATSVNGRYSFLCQANSKYAAIVQSSGTTVLITSEVLATDKAWHFLLLDINATTLKVRFFIDNVQIGSDTSYTGTFAQLHNNFNFFVGSSKNGTYDIVYTSVTSHSDTYVFGKILTAAQQTTLFTRGTLTGAKAHYDCVLREDNIVLDLSGNAYHMTGVNLVKTTKTVKWLPGGSLHSLNVGYTRYTKFPDKDWYIPNLDAGTELTTGFNIPAGYVKDATYAGSLTYHNGADSSILFSDANWDRSDTAVCAYGARKAWTLALRHYYYGTDYKKVWDIAELNNVNISNYFETASRGLFFCKFTGRLLTDLYGFSTAKTDGGTDYIKCIKYCGDVGFLKFDVITDTHICAIKGTKVLKFDDVHTLSLSTDSGATFPTTLVTTLNEVTYAFIFDNGNIMFCDNTKCYYSDDNLATYQESTVTGIDGNPFVAGTLNNFRAWNADFDEVTHDGVKLHTWGSYITGGTAEYDNINQWETTDSGVTVKSVYKFHVSVPDALCRHIHYIKYDSVSDKFWMGTGDDMLDAVVRNNVMQGTRDGVTGVWTWTIIGQGDKDSVWETVGIGFDALYYYFCGEGSNAANLGVKRSLRTDIANIATNQVMIFAGTEFLVDFRIEGTDYIICFGGSSGDDEIAFSQDGENFFIRRYAELTVNTSWGMYFCRGKLTNGYYLFQCNETGETIDNYTKGSTILIKPSVIS